MTTELSTAKYLAPDVGQVPLTEGPAPAPAPVPVATEADTPLYAPVAPESAPQPVRQRPTWTVGLTIIAALLGLFGFTGAVGGAFGAIGQYGITNTDPATIAKFQKQTASQAIVYQRTIAKRKQFSTVIYFHNGMCFLVGLGFLLSAAMLFARKTEANSVASTVCLAAIMYNCLTFVVTWLTLPSFKGLPNMPEGAAQMAIGVAIAFTGVIVLFKIAMYLGFVYYFSRPRIKAVFA